MSMADNNLFTKSTIKIPSATPGWDLDAWYFLPSSSRYSKPHPVVIMAHGLSCNKLMAIEAFAEEFSSIGYACIMFDYRRWGASDGTPRNVIYVKEQLEDFRTVMRYASLLEEIDATRLILWGSSFSGGHVTTIAAEPTAEVAAVIAQVPYTGGLPRGSLGMKLGVARAIPYGVLDYLSRLIGARPWYIPVSGKPGGLGILGAPGCLDGFKRISLEEGIWENTIGAAVLFELLAYSPRNAAASVKRPILVVICGKDNLCPADRAKIVADSAVEAEGVFLDEAGHFDLYSGAPYYAQNLKAQLDFLKRVVPINRWESDPST